MVFTAHNKRELETTGIEIVRYSNTIVIMTSQVFKEESEITEMLLIS